MKKRPKTRKRKEGEARKRTRRGSTEREAKPESEKGKRKEPGDKAEATETTVEGATLATRRWSVPRQTLRVRPKPELREPPTVETPDLAIYDTHTDTVWGGGGILLKPRQHHTRGFSTRRLYRHNRS